MRQDLDRSQNLLAEFYTEFVTHKTFDTVIVELRANQREMCADIKRILEIIIAKRD